MLRGRDMLARRRWQTKGLLQTLVQSCRSISLVGASGGHHPKILEQRKAVLPRLAVARVALPAFLQAVVLPGPRPVVTKGEQLAVRALVMARVALPVDPLTAVLLGPNLA